MREPASYSLGDLDLDLVRRIDAVCRRFEADYRAGKSPVIADYLGEIPEVGRSALRSELIGLEQELRRSDETSARPDSGPIADAPTIAPASLPTAPIPGLGNPSVHEEATVAPRDQATVDLGSCRASAARCLRTGPCPLFRRLRDRSRAGPRRHGRRLPRPPDQPEPARWR